MSIILNIDQKASQPGINRSSKSKHNADVSIVLNTHNESRYIKRTLLSLEEAVQYAERRGVICELCVVLDNPDHATSCIIKSYSCNLFVKIKTIEVRNGSLGPSRNDGIEIAEGKYILTADADDLMSFDSIYKSYITAEAHQRDCVVFPEFLMGFGSKNYVWKFYPLEYIGGAAFFERHPYISRIFAPRLLLLSIRYQDTAPRSGYAYEDWHFNSRLLEKNVIFAVATGTILFYRQRPGSLLSIASLSQQIIPASEYFSPMNYVRMAWRELGDNIPLLRPSTQFTADEFCSSPGIVDLVAAANRIDPAISLGILRHGEVGSNLAPLGSGAKAYFQLCQSVGTESFSDVVLLPYLVRGGAEKYILSVLESLQSIDPATKILILSGEKTRRHEWADKLPSDVLFVDLQQLGIPDLTDQDREYIAFRLVQNLSGVCRIHIKGSAFGDNFIKKYASKLKQIPIYFYYFCNGTHWEQGYEFSNGHAFEIISEYGSSFAGIISDHAKILEQTTELIGCDLPEKSHAIYAPCVPYHTVAKDKLSHQLLWASRLDDQKRPGLIRNISALLLDRMPEINIHVYGGRGNSSVTPDIFDGLGNVVYRGEYHTFTDIAANEYDAFLYTSSFDGLPNVVLEAISAGLPVVAPNIGGIPEVLTEDTGYLLSNSIDAEIMASKYLAAIEKFYQDPEDGYNRARAAKTLISERHSREAFNSRVKEVFGGTIAE
ncbi:glycosyltransferase [Methylobacterium radiotolerans]|uniref:glycosyltransferase n=1 Tax=Methylobacterium radiotolerans TaxID=31998 RepID=UPI001F3ACE27|nr:glycosyltransferase [Methylobacterium radiotolerans]UIY43251.1 glycosyltransferase [Methylobacterium radiotolerans]